MSEEPKDNPNLKMDKNMVYQKMKVSSSFIF